MKNIIDKEYSKYYSFFYINEAGDKEWLFSLLSSHSFLNCGEELQQHEF